MRNDSIGISKKRGMRCLQQAGPCLCPIIEIDSIQRFLRHVNCSSMSSPPDNALTSPLRNQNNFTGPDRKEGRTDALSRLQSNHGLNFARNRREAIELFERRQTPCKSV